MAQVPLDSAKSQHSNEPFHINWTQPHNLKRNMCMVQNESEHISHSHTLPKIFWSHNYILHSSREPSSVSQQAQGNSTLRTSPKVSNGHLSFPFVAQPLGVSCNHRHPALRSGQPTFQFSKLRSQSLQGQQHDAWRIQGSPRNSSKVSNEHFFFTLIAQPFGALCNIRHPPSATTWSCIALTQQLQPCRPIITKSSQVYQTQQKQTNSTKSSSSQVGSNHLQQTQLSFTKLRLRGSVKIFWSHNYIRAHTFPCVRIAPHFRRAQRTDFVLRPLPHGTCICSYIKLYSTNPVSLRILLID